jgi:hypothetical protein
VPLPRSSRALLGAICLLGLIGHPLGAQAPAPAGPTPPPVTVGGIVFGQFAYFLSDTAGHGNNFDVTRAYLNVLGRFPHGIATRVTPDIYRAGDGSLAFRLKYAFVAWTPERSPLTLKLGLLTAPYIEWEETLWDYRMQGTVALDRNGYLSSSDLGFLAEGSWRNEGITFSAGLLNGESFNRAPGDKRKDLAGRITVRLAASDDSGRTGGLRVTGYAHYGTPTGGGRRERYVGVASYRSKLLTLGVVGAATRDSAGTQASRSGRVLSLFGVLRVPKSAVQAIGRVDRVDPGTSTGNDATTRWILGLAYQLAPNVRVLADLDHLAYQGGAPTPALEAARSQALFQIQFTF